MEGRCIRSFPKKSSNLEHVAYFYLTSCWYPEVLPLLCWIAPLFSNTDQHFQLAFPGACRGPSDLAPAWLQGCIVMVSILGASVIFGRTRVGDFCSASSWSRSVEGPAGKRLFFVQHRELLTTSMMQQRGF